MIRQFIVGARYTRAQVFASPLIVENVGNRNAVLRLQDRALCLVVNADAGRWTNEIGATEVVMEVNRREVQFAPVNEEIRTAPARGRKTWMFFKERGQSMFTFLGEVWCMRQDDLDGRLFLVFARQRPVELGPPESSA